MACPLFSDGARCRCHAVRGHHVPTLYERERYCKAAHDACPTLNELRLRVRLLDEEEYLRLWTDAA
jgi:hypothetical protein